MDSYIPQLPQLRLPHQISQLFNQLSTTTDHDDYSTDEDSLDGYSDADDSSLNEEADSPRAEEQTSTPFYLRWQGTINEGDEGDSSTDDDMELIGRFSMLAAPRQPKKLKKRKKKGKTPSTEALPAATAPADTSDQWLIQKYFQQFNESWNAMRYGIRGGGEPAGILAAEQPSVYPPIQRVRLTESVARTVAGDEGYNSEMFASSSAPVGPGTSSHDSKKKKKKRTVRRKVTPAGGLGEAELRERIKEIRNMQLTDRDRDKRVQRLMTAQYYSMTNTYHPEDLYEETDEDATEEEEEVEEQAVEENTEPEPESSTRKPIATLADLKPTYFDQDEGILGCQHYQRGCKLECSTCFKWYTCRLCHDEVEGHKLIRPDTQHMLCMHCGKVQTVAQECAGCSARLARYYCSKCKLWDDASDKSIYHCDDCGLCRIGEGLGKDFFHCKTCSVCMSIDLQDSHRCIEHSTECDCPICGEYMFTSTETVVFMQCGHSIHQNCYRQHTKTSYKCPTCARSIINMAAQFRILDTEIERQPMPDPYDRWRAIIVCNDCLAKSRVVFHFLGLKCVNCGSYNTAQHKIIKPDEAHFLTDAEDDENAHQFGRNNNNSISWNMSVGTIPRPLDENGEPTVIEGGEASSSHGPDSEIAIPLREEYNMEPDISSITYESDEDDQDEIISHSEVRLLHF